MPASSSLRIVLRPCARSSRADAGVPATTVSSRRFFFGAPFFGAGYDSLMLPSTVAEAARRFADRTAYGTPRDWELSYAAIDAISDEVAGGLAAEGVEAGNVVAII